MTKLIYETNPFLDELMTHVCDEKMYGKHYFYELEETIFFVEGGGQLKDEGTINGIPVLSCVEKDGHIYHETAVKISENKVRLNIDRTNRYISRQGHTAQHLLSAGFYECAGIPTISHHYDLRGSYIDLDTDTILDELLEKVELWVNEAIRAHHNIEVLYPTEDEIKAMPIHHKIKATDRVRIVHIDGIEYNPCKGLHVDNTAEVGLLVIFGTEIVKHKVRIHYFFGEVARRHLHIYHDELKKISTALSKPMENAYEGLKKLEEQTNQLQLNYDELADELINIKLNQLYEQDNHHYMAGYIEMNQNVSSRLIKQLQTYEDAYGYIIFNRRLLAFANKKSGYDAKMLFQKAKEHFHVKGGGHSLLCQGGLPNELDINEIIQVLKEWLSND